MFLVLFVSPLWFFFPFCINNISVTALSRSDKVDKDAPLTWENVRSVAITSVVIGRGVRGEVAVVTITQYRTNRRTLGAIIESTYDCSCFDRFFSWGLALFPPSRNESEPHADISRHGTAQIASQIMAKCFVFYRIARSGTSIGVLFYYFVSLFISLILVSPGLYRGLGVMLYIL